jgi:hypothetical protein
VPLLLPLHIAAAALGLVAGAVALAVAKGGLIHRRSGTVFTYAIVAMCATATVAAIVKGQAVNVMAALMTTYFVLTGLMTVRPRAPGSRQRDVGLMLMALALGLATISAGLVAIASPSGKVFGYPPFPFFLFGVLGLSGGAGDFRMIRSGALRGAPRLARHLWRMCMALFITAASFFSIRARVAAIFPEAFASPLARALPVLLVLGTMCYWLWRIRSRAIPARA